jgi:serine/threonine protein phosphatase 1
MTPRRTIVIGDIHSCWNELQRLLEKCRVSPEDEIVSVGDLVDRGPEPGAVVRFFRERPGTTAVLGNHEDKHVRLVAGESIRPGKSQLITRQQLGTDYTDTVAWFRTLPLWLERHGCLIVHAGINPGIPVDRQPRNALLRGLMPWMENIFDVTGPFWPTVYDGLVPVVFGHSVCQNVVVPVNNAWGIDTGACFGSRLTALILPRFEVVQVEARRDYWAEAVARFERERRYAREEELESRPADRPRRGPVIVDGITIDGKWLLSVLGLARTDAGPWIGEVIKEIRQARATGTIFSIHDVEYLARERAPAP